MGESEVQGQPCMKPCLKTKMRNEYHQMGWPFSLEHVEVGKGEKMHVSQTSETEDPTHKFLISNLCILFYYGEKVHFGKF